MRFLFYGAVAIAIYYAWKHLSSNQRQSQSHRILDRELRDRDRVIQDQKREIEFLRNELDRIQRNQIR